jgi:signal transduction histidine kinase/ActR/RegA family two-component response regulator
MFWLGKEDGDLHARWLQISVLIGLPQALTVTTLMYMFSGKIISQMVIVACGYAAVGVAQYWLPSRPLAYAMTIGNALFAGSGILIHGGNGLYFPVATLILPTAVLIGWRAGALASVYISALVLLREWKAEWFPAPESAPSLFNSLSVIVFIVSTFVWLMLVMKALEAARSKEKKSADEITELNQTLRAINRANYAVAEATDEPALMQSVVEIIVDEIRYPIVQFTVPTGVGQQLRIAAKSGVGSDFTDQVLTEHVSELLSKGSAGRALREGKVFVDDLESSSALKPWRERLRRHGVESSASFPVIVEGKPVAALTIVSANKHAFGAEDLKLLEELAQHVSVGFARIRAKQRAEAEQRVREEVEAQLAHSQKLEAVGRLAGGIAHDFNNLLMVIMVQTELLAAELNGELLGRAEGVMKSAQRAAELTRQLLAFSRKQTIQPKVTTLNDVLTGVSDLVERLVGENINVRVVPCREPWPIRIDRSQFEQVVMNLVVNARDAMPEGGKLTIETANYCLTEEYAENRPLVEPGDYAMVAVTDTGSGISPEVQERIFEPFFTTKEFGKGTGLGLSLVYGIVKQAGGFVWVYSEMGKGTTFKIYLPRTQETPKSAEREQVPDIEAQRKKTSILLVEDDEHLRTLISDILVTSGHTAFIAGDLEDAYALAESHRNEFEIVLTDVLLKSGNGKQLAEKLRQDGHIFKVIYMSGYTPNAIVHNGMLDPGILFLQKPFTRNALLTMIEKTLRTV